MATLSIPLPNAIGPYQVVRPIGEGGMGAVFEARHAQSGRRVAIKLLLPQYANQPDVVARFFNEARAMTALAHPSIVQVFECGQTNVGAFMAMEFLEGETVTARLKRTGPMGPQAVMVARVVAEALAMAHARGVVHRDLKPDNIMLARDPWGQEQPKVLDFGIAKIAQDGQIGGSVNAVKTQTGMVLGTPQYMSPEQCRGVGGISGKTDVYSLGAMLFHMVSGKPPFVGGIGEIIAKHVYEVPPPLRELVPSCPQGLSNLVSRMLEKAPDARPSMDEAAGALAAMERGEFATLAGGMRAPSGVQRTAKVGPSKAPLIIGVVLALIGVIAGGTVLVMRMTAKDDPVVKKPDPPRPDPDKSDKPKPDRADKAARPGGGPSKVLIKIYSEPSAADVFRVSTGEKLGTTPFFDEEERSDTDPLNVVLRKRGYEDTPLQMDLAKDGSETVKLKAKPKQRGGSRTNENELKIVPMH